MKRVITLVAAMALILTSCNRVCEHEHTWDGELCTSCGETRIIDKYDEATNTYYVVTAEGLYSWKEALKQDQSTNLVLIGNIDLSADVSWDVASSTNGCIDGQNYSIKGLTNSFIMNIKDGGILKNINFEDVNIVKKGFASVIYRVEENATVENCRVSGSLNATADAYAGLVGFCTGTVIGCVNEATVYTGHYGAGGIVGCSTEGTVVGCMNLSTSISGPSNIGSIVGQNYSKVYGSVGVVSTSGDGSILATECANNVRTGETIGCINIEKISDLTEDDIATMNEAIKAAGYNYEWEAGVDGAAPTLKKIE